MMTTPLIRCPSIYAPIVHNKSDKDAYLNAAKNGNVELVKEYMSKGNSESTSFYEDGITTSRIVDEQGRTALILASANGHIDVVKLFTIERPNCFTTAGINHEDNNNKTALMVAREAGHTNIVNLLVDAGATDPQQI